MKSGISDLDRPKRQLQRGSTISVSTTIFPHIKPYLLRAQVAIPSYNSGQIWSQSPAEPGANAAPISRECKLGLFENHWNDIGTC